jgi:adenylate cyclase
LADVFISYAKADQKSAARASKMLQAQGFEVWWDVELPAHRAYSDIIEKNLEEARAVVVLWSKTAAKSQWVRAEADFARNAGKLVQATLDGSIPPLPFNQIQCADLRRWRSAQRHSGWSKLHGSVAALVSGEIVATPVPIATAGTLQRLASRWWIAGCLVLLAFAAAAFLFFGKPAESRKPVLAVLPFRSLNAQDESLVAGIWEDTRQAIGRNPQLVVLGPNSAQKIAEAGEKSARKVADYLLEASVRTAGDRIRVSADLVRTEDGEQVWSQNFDRKLDDVFALQSDIASQIEGRIRGRLAENGGVKPEHIATSGDVYALYSNARAKIRKREYNGMQESVGQLKEVVRLDPNFAPGWATLSEAIYVTHNVKGRESEKFARRAIELAPNLAAGHGALALSLDLKGPVARAEIERAIALDPNDFETATWLGNFRTYSGDFKGAVEAYRHAVSIEPLFWPGVINMFSALQELRDTRGMAELMQNERKLGADHFVAAMEVLQATENGDLANALNTGLAYIIKGTDEDRSIVTGAMLGAFVQLDFADLALRLGELPDFGPYLWRNDSRGLDLIESHQLSPLEVFSRNPLSENVARVCVLTGQSRRLADMYLSLGKTAEQFSQIRNDEHFLYSAPIIARALHDSGHAKEAAEMLAVADAAAGRLSRNDEPTTTLLKARVAAAEGRKDDAIRLLGAIIVRGWIPTTGSLQADLHNDPALSGLRGDPRFEKLRDQVLAANARQKASVDMNLVRRAGAMPPVSS